MRANKREEKGQFLTGRGETTRYLKRTRMKGHSPTVNVRNRSEGRHAKQKKGEKVSLSQGVVTTTREGRVNSHTVDVWV